MPRQGVQYVNNEEPSFIRQFKQRIGHKDEPDINAKRNIPNFDEDSDEDDRVELEDEKPVVVVLKEGHLSKEEAQVEQTKIDQGPARLDEKIKFKKPTKRTAEQPQEGVDGSAASDDSKKKKEETKTKSKKSKTSAPQNLHTTNLCCHLVMKRRKKKDNIHEMEDCKVDSDEKEEEEGKHS
ncbi:hypothetical protein EGW08_000034 [Elysia chlorotica]|uniref:DUF4604 domain-containing protein n=1 Tax=Elysia chlorotica TaxID=188477 RepID=A0A433UEA0_ELYCH|nr:hypothetical protein EGW08_000034 [Elysia chlorotica]